MDDISTKLILLLLLAFLAECKVSKYEIREIEGVESALEKGIGWLKNEKNLNCGWKNAARAVIAILLTQDTFEDYEKKFIIKELDFAIALQLRNINSMSIEEMALNINAMLAACRSPRSYYDVDLVQWIENKEGELELSPSVLLAFCNANVSYSSHRLSILMNAVKNGITEAWAVDAKIIAALALACLCQNEEKNNMEDIENVLKDFKKFQCNDGSFGNIYQTALAVQVWLQTNTRFQKLYKIFHNFFFVLVFKLAIELEDVISDETKNAIKYLISKQEENGSFGNILTTYLVLPILVGKTLLNLKYVECEEECQERSSYSKDYEPNLQLEAVTYFLELDDKREITRSIIVRVPGNSRFLEVMKVAASRDVAYKFEYSGKMGHEAVYSIGGKYNDPELQRYWQLSFSQDNRRIPVLVSERIRPGGYYSFSYKTKQLERYHHD